MMLHTKSMISAAALTLALMAGAAAAYPIMLHAGAVTYSLDPATLAIDASDAGGTGALMPALHPAETATPVQDKDSWRWTDAEGRTVTAGLEDGALHLTITAATGTHLAWDLPAARTGTWLVPDGEGIAYRADDAFWRNSHHHEHCLGASAGLSFPAWSYMEGGRAVTYALGDGLRSEFCLHDAEGLQARLTHDFAAGTQTLDLLFAIRPADPLAPALFYRQWLKAHGRFTAFADKAVPQLPRLFGAPQAYVWGDGRDLAFLDDLKALGIRRIVLTYDQDIEHGHQHLAGTTWIRKANAAGYLTGPYDIFENAQPEDTDDSPYVHWDKTLYPGGCIRDAKGQVVPGFANRGCELSSEALARHPGAPNPDSRYAAHVAEGASEVFIDSDAYGDFYEDFSPDHPMTMAQDRVNRLARLGLAIHRYHLVMGSENVTAWATGVTHFSHGTAQAHVSSVWKLLNDNTRFAGWWPPDRPAVFFKPSSRRPTRRAPCSVRSTGCPCSKPSSTIPSSPPTAGNSA